MNKLFGKIAVMMTSNPIVVNPNTTLYEAHGQMVDNDIRRVPVVDHDGGLLGIITLSDILKAIPLRNEAQEIQSELLLSDQYVRQIMSSDPLFVAPDDSIQDAAEMMLEYKVSGLPVVEGERVVGIITESDIFRLIVESWEEITPDK